MTHYFSSNTIIILVIKPVNIVLSNKEIVDRKTDTQRERESYS